MTPFLNKETPTLGSADRSRGLPGEERQAATDTRARAPGRPAPPPGRAGPPQRWVHAGPAWPATATQHSVSQNEKENRRGISRTAEMK